MASSATEREHLQRDQVRVTIPRSIVEERNAFEAGEAETYLGLTRDEWITMPDVLRNFCGLD